MKTSKIKIDAKLGDIENDKRTGTTTVIEGKSEICSSVWDLIKGHWKCRREGKECKKCKLDTSVIIKISHELRRKIVERHREKYLDKHHKK